MAYDFTTGRTRVGLAATDASQDAEISAAMSAALAFAERYCDRKFAYAREKLYKAVDRDLEGIFVDRYPIATIHSISGTSATPSYSKHSLAGVVHLKTRIGLRSEDVEVIIDYEGGYKVLPADLEFALWAMFDAVWPTFDPSVSTGGGGTTVAIGAVKKRTIVGVGSVEYETGGGGSSSGSGSVAADWSAVMPGATQAILDLYSRKVA